MMLRPSSINQINFKTLYFQKILVLNPLAYWRLNETGGNTAIDSSGNGWDGARNGATFNGDTFLDGTPAATFDGVNDSIANFAAGFLSAIDGQEGTILGWFRVPLASIWTDATVRRIFNVEVDASNRLHIGKSATNNALDLFYRATATQSLSPVVGAILTWTFCGITYSLTNNRMRGFVGAAQSGATQTGLGTFTGTPTADRTAVGMRIVSANTSPWEGSLSNIAIFDYELTPAQMASLATV